MQISEYYDSVASFWDDDFSGAKAARIVASTVSIPRGGACVLDVGCGSGSMFLDLMEAGACEIEGVDISGAAVYAVNCFHESYGMPCRAACVDVLCPGAIPRARFDVALLFKLLPLLERQRTGAARAVMSAVNAEYLVASFPTRTLGGRNVGMAAQYSGWMEAHVPAGRSVAASFEMGTELFYVLGRA